MVGQVQAVMVGVVDLVPIKWILSPLSQGLHITALWELEELLEAIT